MLAFIYIARGSAGEVRSMLRLLQRRLDRLQANPGAAEQAAPGQDGAGRGSWHRACSPGKQAARICNLQSQI
jgi:invasion protein IalB